VPTWGSPVGDGAMRVRTVVMAGLEWAIKLKIETRGEW
jgi:hypothetical protein